MTKTISPVNIPKSEVVILDGLNQQMVLNVTQELYVAIEQNIRSGTRDRQKLRDKAVETLFESIRKFLKFSGKDGHSVTQAKTKLWELFKEASPRRDAFVRHMKIEIPYIVDLTLLTDTVCKMGPTCKGHIDDVIKQIKALKVKGKESVPLLTDALNKTYQLMNREITPAIYKQYANKMSGSASPELNILAGLMMALSVVFLVTCFAPLVITGSTIGLVAIGLFATNRKTGLSKAMCRLLEDEPLASEASAKPVSI